MFADLSFVIDDQIFKLTKIHKYIFSIYYGYALFVFLNDLYRWVHEIVIVV